MNKCVICNTETKYKKVCSTKCKSKLYNSKDIQRQRGFTRKKQVILSLGGKCSRCGYDRNLTCLTFHHVDQKTKSFEIDLRKFANCKIETLNEEISKCVLLCRNCHGEIEYPHFNDWCNTLNVNK
jgi:hypothetical protein